MEAANHIPSVTPEHVEDEIAAVHFFNGLDAVKSGRITRDEPVGSEDLALITFCVIVLKNGFTVTGQSACAHPAKYCKKTGEDIALRNAKEKIWPLLGYELKTLLHLERANG